ncbi:tRNA (guanosine(46)-N7)-methyltransferase TrmB [Parasphaerochaeta coccoides]|uniref:tRNA (guanine-N(7)-)-methyltransferase n=1 Tax=Parasphaerochaeta coccoides (strain ATCC BAA-1237 / DSM 17374 / SPN1) TaxID=760011 RepID=F4GKY8_PARC1|nr:tRNA (guanosine(46)-N7)-methyltransferase TrmB [Parasphaerochaeta coccoides]AEC01901.1 tRNA (guanine-N(7)-)-methyltransferase [Parasphaerochaeta coccoides DSM 17374]
MPAESQKSVYETAPDIRNVELPAEDKRRGVKSYVLRGGRLHKFQVEALRLYAKEYSLPYSGKPLDWRDIFHNDNPVVIEIGFGMGDSTARIARENPDINYVGIEVFLSGFSKLLHEVGTAGIRNVRLMRFDAVEVLRDMIPENSVHGFHIFFPDPWPKKKHHKRRLIQVPFAELLVSRLKPAGYIYCVTDWQEYAEQMLEVFAVVPALHNPYHGFAPCRTWRPLTKFEQKGMDKQHPINEVWVEKNTTSVQ